MNKMFGFWVPCACGSAGAVSATSVASSSRAAIVPAPVVRRNARLLNMTTSWNTSVARHRRSQLPLHVHVHVPRDVVDHLDDPPARERELPLVVGADRVTAVVTDAQAFAAERIVSGLYPELAAVHRRVVDVPVSYTHLRAHETPEHL